MIIDAMDLLYTQKLGALHRLQRFDFTPLAMRIRTNGLKVFGFGEKKRQKPLNACSFLFLESLAGEAPQCRYGPGAARRAKPRANSKATPAWSGCFAMP